MKVAGCNPNTVTTNPTGGGRAIAIVDAYDDPDAATDIANFSTQFGLTGATFSVVYATGSKPATDPTGGWELEESLDIEWAHAMAPDAKIYLVEAASNSYANLFTAENVASSLVSGAGGGEVSNSWGGTEFGSETSYDSTFGTTGVVYFASSGDSPGTIWPGTSPNVVSAGGTSTARNPYTGNFIHELTWESAGGGVSSYEARPGYQNAIKAIVGPARGVPDLSADADPETGVWVLDSFGGGWYVVGGTSVASPVLAGIVNSAGNFYTNTADELATIYAHRGKKADFHDLKLGYCGPYLGFSATAGWDFCTGVGSDNGKTAK
jgi:subtilase family serine protease